MTDSVRLCRHCHQRAGDAGEFCNVGGLVGPHSFADFVDCPVCEGAGEVCGPQLAVDHWETFRCGLCNATGAVTVAERDEFVARERAEQEEREAAAARMSTPGPDDDVPF